MPRRAYFQRGAYICFDYTLGRACKPECSYYGWRHACQNCRRGCAFGEGRYECSKCAESPPLEVAPAEPSGSTSDEPHVSPPRQRPTSRGAGSRVRAR